MNFSVSLITILFIIHNGLSVQVIELGKEKFKNKIIFD